MPCIQKLAIEAGFLLKVLTSTMEGGDQSQQTKLGKRQIASRTLTDYCNSTTAHGLSYLLAPRYTNQAKMGVKTDFIIQPVGRKVVLGGNVLNWPVPCCEHCKQHPHTMEQQSNSNQCQDVQPPHHRHPVSNVCRLPTSYG